MQNDCVGRIIAESFDAIDLKRWELNNVTEEIYLKLKGKYGRIIAKDENNNSFYLQVNKYNVSIGRSKLKDFVFFFQNNIFYCRRRFKFLSKT